MPAAEVERQIGPEDGRLLVRTSREGLAAQAGHDLTIELTRWSGRLRVGADPTTSELSVTVDMGSMRVVEATGGITPLSERERAEILRNARKILSVDRYPEATLVADTIRDDVVEGTLTLRGQPHELRLAHEVDGDRHRLSGTVRQSDHGIKPFSALFGALRLADGVRVEAELDLSARS